MEGNTKKCSTCGAVISKNSKFCEYCGAKLFLNQDEILQGDAGTLALKIVDTMTLYGNTVVSGKASQAIKVGAKLKNSRTGSTYQVLAIEIYRQVAQMAKEGEVCGLMLDGNSKECKKGDELYFE